MTILGTRPEVIRLAPTIARLDAFTDHVLVHTGQNYDYELNQIFFEDLNVRKPDHFLNVDTSSLGSVLGGVLVGSEALFRQHRPDAVLILGDTNSAIAALVARRMKIPVYHMEAGNRSFDRNVPEETNRRVVDHLADFNLVYTEHARRNLLREGLEPRRIVLTGSPMREVLDRYRDRIQASDVLSRLGIEAGRYLVVSMHREENVDSNERLTSLVETLSRLAEAHEFPVIVSTHPRTRNRLDALADINRNAQVRFLKPFGFHDYIYLQQHAYCTVSDSGTIAEESAILDFPAVTPRDSIERPEAIDVGSIIATGVNYHAIEDAIRTTVALRDERLSRCEPIELPPEYQVTNVSERVVKLILGTARLSNAWDGVRVHDYV